MKKKTLYFMCIAIALLICIIAYFKPLSLADTTSEHTQIIITLNELGVRNGEPYINSIKYQDISTEQKNSILTLLKKFNYRRTFRTLFSNDSISYLGERTLFIYLYHDNSFVNSIFVTSSGNIVVNNKNYRLKNAMQFIAQILEIMAQ